MDGPYKEEKMGTNDISQVIGYKWKPAEKRKPRAFEVIKLRRVGPEGEGNELLSAFDGDRYYIFDLQSGHWVTLEQHVYGPGIDPRVRAISDMPGWLYAYEDKQRACKYIPYYAIAVSRIHEIKA